LRKINLPTYKAAVTVRFTSQYWYLKLSGKGRGRDGKGKEDEEGEIWGRKLVAVWQRMGEGTDQVGK